MSDWITRIPHPEEKRREAVQGEFFAAESIKNEAQALVREGIQNSLDAAVADPVTGKAKPKVRIYVSGEQGALPWSKSRQFFAGAWPHYQAEKSGLVASELPAYGSACQYLVFEDFHTSGLTGDMSQKNQPAHGEENAFYYYLRAEGQSGKSDSDRGRWGIGKFVFPRASRVRSFLALTKRADDDITVVTGQFILKWHTINGEDYSPDGWFGVRGENGILMPTEDHSVIANVKSCFNLSRHEEPGLSLIVPWCRPEINQKVLIQSVLRDFYYPILKGQLEVEVADSTYTEIINEYTFSEVFKKHSRDLTSDEAGTIELAQEATAARGIVKFSVGSNSNKDPVWSEDLVEEDVKSDIRRLLDDGGLVSVRVPVWVHKRMGDPERSEIQIWIKRDETAQAGRPVFIREGLVIPAAHNRLSRGFRSMVLIEDKPIAKLLGDAENPSHTKWDSKSEHFQGKYHPTKGARVITFVRNAVSNFVDVVTKSDGEKDLVTWADVFKALRKEEPGVGRRKTRGTKPGIIKPTPPGDRRAKLWSESKLENINGFAVYSSNEPFNTEKVLSVSVGYDVVKGNPIKRWSPFDFMLDEGKGINISCSGDGVVLDSVKRGGNKFSVRVTSTDFRIEFGGFDPHRDLLVEPRMKEAD